VSIREITMYRQLEYRLLSGVLWLLVGGLRGSVLLSRCGDRDSDGFALFRGRLRNDLVDGGFEDLDGIREGLARSELTFGIPALHDLDFDSKNTLSEQNVADGVIDEVTSGLTGVDHETVGEFHRFGTSSTELARNDDFATLGARLHNETEDTVASATDSETAKELVSQTLALSDSGQTTVLDLLSVEFEGVFGEFETFLDESSELTDAATLLTKDLLGVGSTDDDLSAGVSHTNIATRVTLLSKLPSEEFIEFSAEDTVSHELSLFADLGRHFGGDA